MPSKSKAQQRFFGMISAYQKGTLPKDKAGPEIINTAKSMKPYKVKEFASTSHKGLPAKKAFLKGMLKAAEEMGQGYTPTMMGAVPGGLLGAYLAQERARDEDRKQQIDPRLAALLGGLGGAGLGGLLGRGIGSVGWEKGVKDTNAYNDTLFRQHLELNQ